MQEVFAMNKKDFSKNCLSQALIELLEERPYEEISIQDIVNRAGFSRMAYYRNFKVKDEIIDYTLDNIFETFIKESGINFSIMGSDKFAKLLFEFFATENMIKLTKLLLKNHLVGHMYVQFLKRTQGGFLPNQSHYFYDFIAGGFFSVYISWVLGGMKETPEQMAEGTAKLFNNHTK